jgi:hypothetical protein
MQPERQYTQPIIAAIVRVLLYGGLLYLIAELVYLDSVTLTHTGKFGEQSYTEWSQEVMLFIASLLYFTFSRYDRTITGFAGMMSGMAIMAFIREFNNYFHTLFMGAWQLVALIALIITIIYVYRNRDTFIRPFYEYLKLPAFGVTMSGFVSLMVFSRLFGRGKMWRNILEVDHLEGPYRWVKNAAEEGTELLGYALIFIGTIEYCWFIWNRKRHE